jgi:hypothetical protein
MSPPQRREFLRPILAQFKSNALWTALTGFLRPLREPAWQQVTIPGTIIQSKELPGTHDDPGSGIETPNWVQAATGDFGRHDLSLPKVAARQSTA